MTKYSVLPFFFVYLCFWVRVLAGGLGASPQELYVTEYRVSFLLRSIELGGSAGTIAFAKSNN
ncbi:hypothetical protein AT270_09465 [Bacillus cereus]|nr:hypothetical protein AT270_09465 [Bacillus cereus]